MLSAMTASENLSLSSQSRCSRSPYGGLSAFATALRDDCRDFLLDPRFTVYDFADGDESDFAGGKDSDAGDISELLDDLDLECVACETAGVKPLRIDPNALNLNFATTTTTSAPPITAEPEPSSSSSSWEKTKRTSHHLSGGGLLSDATGGGVFENQISPSSPLTFDLGAAESTNPFSNYLAAEEAETAFSSTNPFRSSLDYENLPRRSFSQCSTRPASPEPTNPFLLGQASPSLSLTPFLAGHLPQPAPSSFIFAVPVFPIFQHHIANSSTQTSDEPPAEEEPVYQNVTNQLRKFMQRNNHSEYDLQCLKSTMKDLRTCGWYYENVSWQESVVLLRNTEPGTFLIRDSSDPNFLFSLSVQTSRGPTSVRLHYVNGQFRLDAEAKLIPHMPSFNSVIELVDYYIENTVKNKMSSAAKRSTKKDRLQKSKEQVWIDSQGNVYSNILLVKPLYKREHFSTLQHLTRLAINRHVRERTKCGPGKPNFRVTPVYESSPFDESAFPVSFDAFNVDSLPLPVTLVNYLKDYPYCH